MTEKRDRLSRLPIVARVESVSEYLRTWAAAVLNIRPDDIDLDAICPDPDYTLNLFRAIALRDLDFPLYPCDTRHCRSLRELADYIAHELVIETVPSKPLGDLYERGAWSWDPTYRSFGPHRNQTAIFLLSAPRSGSTLLRTMLAGHPRLFAPPELHLLPFRSMRARAKILQELGFAWMQRGLISALMSLEGSNARVAETHVTAMEQEDLPIKAVYRRLQEAAADQLLVDKTPTYAFHPAWLRYAENMFEDARYIYLVRHPNAVTESFVRMRFHRLLGQHWLIWDENPWRYAEKCWTTCNMHLSGFVSQIEPRRFISVKYEELVANPKTVAQSICDSLDIPFDSALLSPYEESRNLYDPSGNGPAIGDVNFLRHSGIDRSLGNRWIEHLSPLQFGDATRRLAESLGYDAL